MVIQINRGAEKRQYPGENQARFLIDWLNSSDSKSAPNRKENSSAKAQITQILDGLLRIGATADLGECKAIAAGINEILEKCALVPKVEINIWQPLPMPSKQKMGCSFGYQPAPGTLHYSEMEAVKKAAGRKESLAWPSAHAAFMLLFDIWRDGHILKIRRCENCGDLFFFRKSDQRSCRDRCREALYLKQPEKIKERNKRRRDNYEKEVRRSTRHLKSVKRGK